MSAKPLMFLRYMSTVFDNIKDAVMLMNVEKNGEHFRLLLANKAFHDMSGFRPDCVGKELGEFVHPDHIEAMRQHYKRVTKLKKSHNYSTWADAPVGRRAYEIEIIPVLSTVDEVVQLIVLARDITKVAMLEEKVRALQAAVARKRQPAA